MTQLTWVSDTPQLDTGDPYCDWLCGHGSDFAVRNRMRRLTNSPRDFTALIDLDQNTSDVVLRMPDSQGQQQAPSRADKIRYPVPLPERSFGPASPPSTPTGWVPPSHLSGLSAEDKAKVVVVAVIDDGINIANDRFVDAGGRSRVDFAWVQDAVSDGKLPFGKEIRAAEIDQARSLSNDPVKPLQDLGLLEFSVPGANALTRRASHGTHMADLAAGYGPGDTGYNEAQLRRIITVQLPFLMTQDTSGATNAPFLADGIKFVLDRAKLMGQELGIERLPVVINLSYATSAGPHHGGGRVEKIIDKLLQQTNAANEVHAQIVLPAGNRHLERQHAVTISNGDPETSLNLHWRLQPGDQTVSFLEIWLPETAVPTVTVIPPGSIPAVLSAVEAPLVLHRGNTKNIKTVIARVTRDDVESEQKPEKRRRILVCVAPTEIYDSDRTPAPAGLWEIHVTATLKNGERIEAWIQRDEAPYRFRTNPRQSYFDDPDYERYDPVTGRLNESDDGKSVVKRIGTQSAIATGTEPIVVAGYEALSKSLSRYSASGDPDSPYGAYKPSFTAASDRSKSQPGILASGTLSGSVVAINGTSVAAPQVTRMLADKMAAGSTSFSAAKNVLTARVVAPLKNGASMEPADRLKRTGNGLLEPTIARPFRD